MTFTRQTQKPTRYAFVGDGYQVGMHAMLMTTNLNTNTGLIGLVPVATDPGPEVPPPVREPRPGEPPTPIIPEPIIPAPIIPDPLPPQPDAPQPAQACSAAA